LSGQVYSQSIVNKIEISGNEFFSANEISNSMVTGKDKTFSTSQLETDLKSIREKYRQSGFLFAQIKNVEVKYTYDSALVDLKIVISEGKQAVIGRIEISGNKIIKGDKILREIETRKGNFLDENKLNNDIIAILKLYESAGMPFTKISISAIDIYYENDNPLLELRIAVNEGTKIKIEEIRIKGTETTKNYLIEREINLGKDSSVTVEKIEDTKIRLERLNIFESVEMPKIYTLKSTGKNGLLIEVKEGNNNTFDGVIGYIPPATENESGYFTGLVNLSFRNIFGTGRRLDARWQQEVRSTQELELKYGEPYVLSLPINLYAGFLQRIQDSTYTKRKFEMKSDLLISTQITGSFIGGYDRIIPSTDSNSVKIVSDSRILYAGAELKYDSRDNIFNPSSGIVYRASYIYGNKKIFNQENANFSVQKYYSDIDLYYSFLKRQTTFLKLFWGEVLSSKLEESDYFRIGGNKNIRGYRNEQFLASRFAYENLEFRYSISRRSFLFTFFDAGYYFLDEDSLAKIPKQEGFLYGYGIGAQIETGIGIIGVSYALGKGDGILDGKIHFGLINNF
jgi:outer membrane protein insertion porin family